MGSAKFTNSYIAKIKDVDSVLTNAPPVRKADKQIGHINACLRHQRILEILQLTSCRTAAHKIVDFPHTVASNVR
jgi:hypothetical protein